MNAERTWTAECLADRPAVSARSRPNRRPWRCGSAIRRSRTHRGPPPAVKRGMHEIGGAEALGIIAIKGLRSESAMKAGATMIPVCVVRRRRAGRPRRADIPWRWGAEGAQPRSGSFRRARKSAPGGEPGSHAVDHGQALAFGPRAPRRRAGAGGRLCSLRRATAGKLCTLDMLSMTGWRPVAGARSRVKQFASVCG